MWVFREKIAHDVDYAQAGIRRRFVRSRSVRRPQNPKPVYQMFRGPCFFSFERCSAFSRFFFNREPATILEDHGRGFCQRQGAKGAGPEKIPCCGVRIFGLERDLCLDSFMETSSCRRDDGQRGLCRVVHLHCPRCSAHSFYSSWEQVAGYYIGNCLRGAGNFFDLFSCRGWRVSCGTLSTALSYTYLLSPRACGMGLAVTAVHGCWASAFLLGAW